MTWRALIVDDEPPARGRVRHLLARERDFAVAGEATSGDEAIRMIGELRPDLLFLDVEMPAADGLQVLRAVRDEWMPCVIFTTAHATHAVAAFEAAATDYLLKPYSAERFSQALARARSQLSTQTRSGGMQGPWDTVLSGRGVPLERILVKNGDRYVVVRAQEIAWVEAASNYVVLHTPAGRAVLRRTLTSLEEELDPRAFFRASRSALVRLDEIKEVRLLAEGDHRVILRDGSQIPLTRGLRELQDRLKA